MPHIEGDYNKALGNQLRLSAGAQTRVVKAHHIVDSLVAHHIVDKILCGFGRSTAEAPLRPMTAP
jgi:hypothetical protein